MKTSARNQFYGVIKAIKVGATHDEVVLSIADEQEVTAVVTQESTRAMRLSVGKDAVALVKAPWVVLCAPDDEYVYSTRNQFTGKVAGVIKGAVNAEVFIDVSAGLSMAAIVTNDSIDRLNIQLGGQVTAIFKAAHVILAVKK